MSDERWTPITDAPIRAKFKGEFVALLRQVTYRRTRVRKGSYVNNIPTENIQSPQDAILALCLLQAEVSRAMGYRHAADCFCGNRQKQVEQGYWRNEGVSINFIIDATREKLARENLDVS